MNDTTKAEQNLSAMIDISWNTNWAELPPEAEAEAEKAFEHLANAREITEGHTSS